MAVVLFLICAFASSVGAIVGAGGGVIIKPVVDLFGFMSVSAVSFISGCTVLGMSVSSLLRSRNSGVKLDLHLSIPLAIGSAVGGVIGKVLFELVKTGFGSDALVGGVQSAVLAFIMLLILIYICLRSRLPSLHVRNSMLVTAVGLGLGLVSSFLGIGGGPYIVAVLFLLFSMDAKQAAKNSIFIIMCSQAANLIFTIVRGNVPDFDVLYLCSMVCGGIVGGLIGAIVSKKLNNGKVEGILKALIVVIFFIAIYNSLHFFNVL